MKKGYVLKLIYISKRVTIGVYESVSNLYLVQDRLIKIEEFMREEGKHTMMTVKRLDELGIETPKKGGEIAERFGETIGKAATVLGWRGTCFFMQMGEEMERLFLKAASTVCRNRDDQEILNLIIFDEKKHSEWWRRKLSERRH
ncbi:MAG: ferritin-like domain-containing protein [Deltaproteobacteria bacterium]|nr:ferritin-like domain-containing protein [Deltaproteobacteria bacterium]